MRRIERSCEIENSRPIENIRKTTPNSASAWVAPVSAASPSAWGPISTPDGQVAQHRRQVQAAEDDHAEDGAAEQQKGQFEAGCHAMRVLSANTVLLDTSGKFFAFPIRLYFQNECNR